MLNNQEIITKIESNDYDSLTVIEIVYFWSSYRIVDDISGKVIRFASYDEANENNKQAAKKLAAAGEGIDTPMTTAEIAELLKKYCEIYSIYNAKQMVYNAMDKLAQTLANYLSEKDSHYDAKCLEIHSYMVAIGQVAESQVGSGKWLKEIGIRKADVYNW